MYLEQAALLHCPPPPILPDDCAEARNYLDELHPRLISTIQADATSPLLQGLVWILQRRRNVLREVYLDVGVDREESEV